MVNNKVKIVVLSDNHGFTDEILYLKHHINPDYIISAGDYCLSLHEAKTLFDYFVNGNNDFNRHPEEIYFNIAGVNFFLTHGWKQYDFDIHRWHYKLMKHANKKPYDVLIYGHSHKEIIEKYGKKYIINPGSIFLPRNCQKRKSYIIINIESNTINSIDIKYLD